MESTIDHRVQTLLEDLCHSTRSIRGCLLATSDGVAVTQYNLSQQSLNLAALSASALGIGCKVTEVAECADLEEVSFNGFDGWVSVIAVGTRAVLTTIANEGCSIEMVAHYSRKYAQQVLQILDPEQAQILEQRKEARGLEEHGTMQGALRALAAMEATASAERVEH
jgi:predicted regulator of Ras-like GTPase activity (Roadblock/LC7/MglB family)